MATTGSMNKLATFQRDTGTIGLGGSKVSHWTDIPGLVRVPVEYKPQRGRERVQAGRLEAATVAFIVVQGCRAVRGLTPADVVIVHDETGDIPHRVHSIENPDQMGQDYEIITEKGVQLG